MPFPRAISSLLASYFGLIPTGARSGLRWSLGLSAVLAMVGCGSAPTARVAVYDFGPATAPAAATNSTNALPAVILTDIEAAPAVDGTAVLYRLAYHDAQQLRPYAQARWSMPPAYLLRQRLRQQLGQHRTVGSAADAGASRLPQLRVELEEFSQVFDSATHCQALVRVRATVSQAPVFGVPVPRRPNLPFCRRPA